MNHECMTCSLLQILYAGQHWTEGDLKAIGAYRARNDEMMNNTQRLNITYAMLIMWSVFNQSWGELTDPFTH